MSKINLNSWYIKDSKLSVSLMRYHVSITPIISDEQAIKAILKVVDSNMENNKYNFDNIEDAMMFTENVINNCTSLEEIDNGYAIYEESKKEKVKQKTHQK